MNRRKDMADKQSEYGARLWNLMETYGGLWNPMKSYESL